MPGDLIETWTSDSNCKVEDSMSPSHTGGMGRVIIVEKLSGLHVGTKEEKQFVATIQDPMCSWNCKTFAFKSVNGLLQVSVATEAEKATAFPLTIEGLSAIVYNGIHPGFAPLLQNINDLVIWSSEVGENHRKRISKSLRTCFQDRFPSCLSFSEDQDFLQNKVNIDAKFWFILYVFRHF